MDRHQDHRSFAERHGATILTLVGAALCAAGVVGLLLGNAWTGGLVGLGLMALAFGTVESRLIDFSFLGVRARLGPGTAKSEIEYEPGSDSRTRGS